MQTLTLFIKALFLVLGLMGLVNSSVAQARPWDHLLRAAENWYAQRKYKFSPYTQEHVLGDDKLQAALSSDALINVARVYDLLFDELSTAVSPAEISFFADFLAKKFIGLILFEITSNKHYRTDRLGWPLTYGTLETEYIRRQLQTGTEELPRPTPSEVVGDSPISELAIRGFTDKARIVYFDLATRLYNPTSKQFDVVITPGSSRAFAVQVNRGVFHNILRAYVVLALTDFSASQSYDEKTFDHESSFEYLHGFLLTRLTYILNFDGLENPDIRWHRANNREGVVQSPRLDLPFFDMLTFLAGPKLQRKMLVPVWDGQWDSCARSLHIHLGSESGRPVLSTVR